MSVEHTGREIYWGYSSKVAFIVFYGGKDKWPYEPGDHNIIALCCQHCLGYLISKLWYNCKKNNAHFNDILEQYIAICKVDLDWATGITNKLHFLLSNQVNAHNYQTYWLSSPWAGINLLTSLCTRPGATQCFQNSNFPIRAILTVSNFKSTILFLVRAATKNKTGLKTPWAEILHRRGNCWKSCYAVDIIIKWWMCAILFCFHLI